MDEGSIAFAIFIQAALWLVFVLSDTSRKA